MTKAALKQKILSYLFVHQPYIGAAEIIAHTGADKLVVLRTLVELKREGKVKKVNVTFLVAPDKLDQVLIIKYGITDKKQNPNQLKLF